MSEAQLLYLTLCALYLLECLLWVPRQSVLFASSWGGKWRRSGLNPLFENPHKSLLLCNPLPHLGSTLVCPPWPISISPRGVFSYVSQASNPGQRAPQAERFWPLDEVNEIGVNGSQVLVNGETFVEVFHARNALAVAGLIKSVIRAVPEKRDEVICRALAERMNVETISARYARYAGVGRSLRLQCNLLFVYLFGIMPLLASKMGLAHVWLPLFGTLGLMVVTVLITFFRVHRALQPEAASFRWEHLATMTFCPPAAVRAHHFLSRDLLSGFHPLAVAAALCSRPDFHDYAARVVRDLDHPIQPACDHGDPRAVETESHFRILYKDAVERLLRSTGLDVSTLAGPPPQADDGSQSYCPRCHCQFLLIEGTCSQCGLNLCRFGAIATPPAPTGE